MLFLILTMLSETSTSRSFILMFEFSFLWLIFDYINPLLDLPKIIIVFNEMKKHSEDMEFVFVLLVYNFPVFLIFLAYLISKKSPLYLAGNSEAPVM